MSFGELLTKIAIALTAYSAAKDGIWSEPLAWKLGGTLAIASLIRDANSRWREAIRLMTGYGFCFVGTYLLTGPLMYLLQRNGVTFFRPWEAVFASGVIAMFFRGFMIVCESGSRWIMWFLGWDNKRLDAVHRYMQKQRWEWFFGPRHEEPVQSEALVDDEDYDHVFFGVTPGDFTVVDGTVERCGRCGEPLTGSGRCAMCSVWSGRRIGCNSGQCLPL